MHANVSTEAAFYYVYEQNDTPLDGEALKADAVFLNQVITIGIGENVGNLINYPTTPGMYYAQAVAEGDELGAVAISNQFEVAPYGYTFVATNGTAHCRGVPAVVTSTIMLVCMAFRMKAWKTSNFLIYCDSGSFISINNTTKKLTIIGRDYGAATTFNYASDDVFDLDVKYDIYVAMNFTSNTIEVYCNGLPLAITGTTTPGHPQVKSNNICRVGTDSVTVVNAEIAYVWVNYGTSAPPPPSSFYDNGPMDLSVLPVPMLWRGGTMTADERNGDAGQGWNDQYNMGTTTGIVIGSQTYSDVVT
jgi:hypothetical protein